MGVEEFDGSSQGERRGEEGVDAANSEMKSEDDEFKSTSLRQNSTGWGFQGLMRDNDAETEL